MAMNFRLSDAEEEAIKRRTKEINRELAMKFKDTLKVSELLHVILDQAIEAVGVDEEGIVSLMTHAKQQ